MDSSYRETYQIGKSLTNQIRASALLLDFDGPVCNLFAGHSARSIARELRQLLLGLGFSDAPQSADPFDLLAFAADPGVDQAQSVEQALSEAEIEATSTAVPTPSAHQVIRTWHASRGKLAIVSNNSCRAVRTYLTQHELGALVDVVSARSPSDIARLKPHPQLLLQAIAKLKVDASACVLVGDSPSDLRAARAAGVRAIGYTTDPRRRAQLARENPDAILTRIDDLLDCC